MADTPDNNEPEDLIRYDILAQEALRGVVKKVLGEVASTGALPGDHHFYITFDTSASGVKISPRMREKYPEEMTIVVQHQFWDLKTTETGFQIGLSFNDIGEMLVIPFSAIRGFFDPSVQFGLQFDAGETEETQEAEISALPGPEKREAIEDQTEKPEPEAKEESESGSADVVSLDAFRKK